MDRLPNSRPPLLMRAVRLPVSFRIWLSMSTVAGGRRALPQKLMGAQSRAKMKGPWSPTSSRPSPATTTMPR